MVRIALFLFALSDVGDEGAVEIGLPRYSFQRLVIVLASHELVDKLIAPLYDFIDFVNLFFLGLLVVVSPSFFVAFGLSNTRIILVATLFGFLFFVNCVPLIGILLVLFLIFNVILGILSTQWCGQSDLLGR